MIFENKPQIFYALTLKLLLTHDNVTFMIFQKNLSFTRQNVFIIYIDIGILPMAYTIYLLM